MGHKVNSLIFRSKNFPYYSNVWNNYNFTSQSIKYYLNLQIFIKIKKLLNILYIQSNYYNNTYCIYNIILFSKSCFFKNKSYDKILFLEFLRKNYSKKIKFGLNIVVLKHPLLSTSFILRYLYNKLLDNRKNSLRKIIPQLVLLINKKYKIKGLKCIVSGRINGVQMAKLETFKFNESSLQNKTSDIRYNFLNIHTKYGLLGIKIWLFLN